jgi:hypothetical protein
MVEPIKPCPKSETTDESFFLCNSTPQLPQKWTAKIKHPMLWKQWEQLTHFFEATVFSSLLVIYTHGTGRELGLAPYRAVPWRFGTIRIQTEQ